VPILVVLAIDRGRRTIARAAAHSTPCAADANSNPFLLLLQSQTGSAAAMDYAVLSAAEAADLRAEVDAYRVRTAVGQTLRLAPALAPLPSLTPPIVHTLHSAPWQPRKPKPPQQPRSPTRRAHKRGPSPTAATRISSPARSQGRPASTPWATPRPSSAPGWQPKRRSWTGSSRSCAP